MSTAVESRVTWQSKSGLIWRGQELVPLVHGRARARCRVPIEEAAAAPIMLCVSRIPMVKSPSFWETGRGRDMAEMRIGVAGCAGRMGRI